MEPTPSPKECPFCGHREVVALPNDSIFYYQCTSCTKIWFYYDGQMHQAGEDD